MPIRQNWYFDAFELVKEFPEEEDTKVTGSRYDGHIAIFGNKLQEKLAN